MSGLVSSGSAMVYSLYPLFYYSFNINHMSKHSLLKDNINYSLEYYNSVKRPSVAIDEDSIDWDLLEAREAQLNEALESLKLEIEIC